MHVFYLISVVGRPLSKTVRFNVLQIVASAAGKKAFNKF